MGRILVTPTLLLLHWSQVQVISMTFIVIFYAVGVSWGDMTLLSELYDMPVMGMQLISFLWMI